MNAIPKFVPLEDRIVLDGEASVTIDGPDSVFIGDQDVEFTLTFDNTSPTETGYVPFIDFVLPTGTDGYDGVDLSSVSFLGAPVTTTELVFDGSGNAEHPLAVDTNGDPIIVTGTPGDTLVVIELPYGSFSAGNPPVDIDVVLDFSSLADLSDPFNLSATGGFAFGCDPLDNPADDPSTFGSTDSFVVSQQLFEVTKRNNIPEAEAATGPSYVYTHTIDVEVADGQTLSDFVLVDNLPPEMVYLGNLSTSGVVVTEPTVGAPAGPGNNVLEIDLGSVSGTQTVTFDFYIADVPAGSTTPIIDVNNGDQQPVTNTVTGTGNWDPLDPNDPTIAVSDSDEDIYQATSLAIQKSGAIVVDDGVPGATPDDVYEFTLNVQVSDYFTYGDLLITDTLGNGFTFVDGSAVLVSTSEDGGESITTPVSLTPFETTTLGTGVNAGQTTNVWDISAAMISVGDDGLLTGDDVDGSFDGVNTTMQIVYRATVNDQYADDGTGLDVELSQGDLIRNDTRVSGTVRDNADPTTVVGVEENESSTEVQLPFGAIREKSVFAVNGLPPDPNVVISAGDEVTWRVVYDAPLGSFEDLRIADNLPQNVFVASEVTSFITPADASVPPPAGSAQYGPADEFSAQGGGDPTLTIDPPNNGVNFVFNNLSVDPRAPVAIELLFTVTVEDAIFADGLLLTNQATAFESNTFGGEVDTTAIAQFTYAEPVLGITKGIIATDSTDPDTSFTAATGPTAFTAPGSAGPRFSGVINSDDLAATPINSDLDNIDAGDLVSFAIVVENTGSGPNGAFNVVIEDTLPPGFEVPGTGLNLSVTDGTGTRAIPFTGDLFTGGIQLDDRGPEGSLSAFDPTAGDNLVIITYDLLASQTVTSNDSITNTATLSNYNAFEGDATNVPIDRTPVDLTDDATATVADVEVTKVLESREFGEGAATEVLVGEEFTFTVRMDIQEGTYLNAIVSDTVRTGAAFGDYEILSAEITDWNGAYSASTGVTLGTAGVVAADGNSVSFDLGTLVNAGDNDSTNDFFEFEVTARSLGGDPVSGGDRLANTARFEADGVNASASNGVDLTESDVTIAKTAGPAIVRAGETVNYALDINNVAGFRDAPAYDLVITDVLDPNVTLDVGSVVVTIDGTPVPGAITTGNTAGDTTIQLNIDVLEEGQQLEVTYTATVIPDVEAAITIDNTADLTYDSLPTDDADDERDYTADADASVVTAAPEITKTIVATSNGDTTGTNLSIGETVTYEITVQVPEGLSNNSVIEDVLPTALGTLEYVSSEVIRISFADPAADDITGSALNEGDAGTNVGDTTTFNFGNLTNDNNLTLDAGDEIVVQVTAILVDIPANQSGDNLVNTASFITDTVDISDTAAIDVVEPVLNIDKSGTPAEVDAGDTVTFTVLSENTGNGPAYDIIIDDELADPGLAVSAPAVATIRILDGATDVTPVGPDAPALVYPTGTGGLQASIPVLLPGQTIEIVYDALVTDAAEFDGSVDNTAQVTRYDSDPAGDGTDPDDGRVYDENLDGYTVPSDDESIDTPAPSLDKSIVGTDNPDTAGANVGISEIITYELRIDIPEGTSNVVLSDNLPAGLTPVSATVTTYDDVAMSSNLALGDTDVSNTSAISVGPDGGYVFDFGALTNTGDNNTANDFIIITVEAQVDDIAAVSDGVNLENTATLALVDPVTGDPLIDPDTGLPQTYTDTADVDVVVPVLDIAKTGAPVIADAGDVITYTIESANTGTGPAYDIIISDPLSDTGLAPAAPAVAAIRIEDGLGADVTPTGPDAPSVVYPTGANGLEATIPVLLPGQVIIIEFDTVVTDLAEFDGNVENTAEVTRFDTDPAGDGTDADDGRVYDASNPDHTVPTASQDFDTPPPSISKTVVGTDDPNTAGADVGIGEVITYELRIDIPEGTSNLILTDDLPTGLSPISAEVTTYDAAAITSNLTLGDTDVTNAAFISVGPDGGYVFDFGALTNTGDNNTANDFIIITVEAQVDDIAAVSDGVNLENTATLAIVDPITGDPLIDPDTGLPQTYADTADVDVVEPALDIDKTVLPLTADAGDVVTYTVRSENIGTAPAYDVIINDALTDSAIEATSPGVFTITIEDGLGADVTPGGLDAPTVVYPTGAGGLEATIPVLLPGQIIVIEFDAVVTDAAEFSGDVDNTAEVTRFDSDPAGDGTDPDDGRVYDSGLPGYTVPTDDAEITTPGVTLDKSYSDSSDPATDNTTQEVSIGEEITYLLTITVPEGSGDLLLTDVLPGGLEALSARVVSLGDGTNTTTDNLVAGDTDASSFITIAPGGTSVTFDFGTAVITGTDDAAATDETLVVEVVSRVRNDVVTNVDTAALQNTATLAVSDPITGAPLQPDVTSDETVTIVTPAVTIEKTGPIAANPGDLVDYQFVIENSGTGPAHDLFIEDLMSDPELALEGTPTFTINPGGTVITPTVNPAGLGGFSTLIPTLAAGETLTVDFQVRVALSAADAQSFPNNATIDYDTVPDGDPDSPTGVSFEDEDDHSVGTVPFLVKTATDSELSTTGDGEADPDNLDLVVGEEVTYTFDIYLPEVPMDSVVVVDTLPPGLQFISADFISAGTGLVEGGTATAITASSVTITNMGQMTTFDFGAVDNPNDTSIGADDVITVEIVALVIDDPTVTSDGDTLTNTATLDVSAGGVDLNTAVATEVVDVVEPELTIDKTGTIAAEPGETVSYSVTIENTGTGPAYDTTITDLMDDPFVNFVTGSVNVVVPVGQPAPTVTAAGDGFTFDVPLLLPGEVVTITYDATIANNAPETISYLNTISADYTSSPDGDGRDSAASDDHAIGGSPTLDKAILSTSIGATDDDQFGATTPDLVIGEEVTYALTITLPEIPMDSVVLEDELPDGLIFVSASVEPNAIGATATITNVGQITTIDFGSVTNPFDGSIGADDEITVLVTARVSTDLANTEGRILTNTADLNVTPEGEPPFTEVMADATVEIVEPNVTVDKTGPIATDQGDTVPFVVTIVNDGTGPAADLLFTDTMDPGGVLTYDAGSFTAILTPGDGSAPVDLTGLVTVTPSGNGFTVQFDALLPDDVITLNYTATLAEDAPRAQSFVNTADVVFDTVPDGDPETPTGRPGGASDDHSVATNPGLDKSSTDSSFDGTGSDQGDPDNLDLNIGEEVTFTLEMFLPEILMDSVVLQDTLPAGLSFVSAQVVDLAGVVPAAPVTITNVGQVTTFDFGVVNNPSDGSLGLDDLVVVEIVALVENIPSNVAVTPLTNTATLNITPNGEPPLEERSDTETVEVVEPELEIEKTAPLAVNPGDTIPYTVTVTNTGTGAAFDTLISDAVSDPSLNYTPGSVVVTLDGVVQTLVVDESGTGFAVELPLVQAGQTVVVTYDVVLDEDAPATNSFRNDATVDYDNYPGDPDPADNLERPGDATDDHIIATIPTLEKNVVATSNPDTGDDVHDGGLPDLNVSEQVTFELILTLPEIPMDDVVLVDQLPVGLTFVSFEVTEVGSGLTAGAPVFNQSGQTLTFDFGAVTNPFDGSIGADDRIVVQVVAEVADIPSNANGAQLTNTGALTVTPEGEAPLDTQEASTTVEVVDPILVLSKTVNDITPIVGDTITYTLVLTNDGTGPSYNIVIDDPLPFQLSLTGAVTLSDPSLATVRAGSTAGETELIIDIPRLLPGETITIDYDVFIGFESDVLTGLVNTADVVGSTSPDPDAPGRGTAGRNDAGTDDAIIVADPIPTDDRERERIPHLGIDDAQFLPVLTIDPIYSGTAEPGSNVTVSLYRDDGSLSYARHILADAGGHWIALFPRVEYEAVEDDFFDFYAGSNVFDAPVRLIDTADRTGLSFAGEQRELVVGADIAEEAYDLKLSADRSSMLPQDHPMHNARTFYANAQHQMPFLKADVLRVDEVFENIAADVVARQYEAAVNPLGDGLNRFNYEFLTDATASPGSPR